MSGRYNNDITGDLSTRFAVRRYNTSSSSCSESEDIGAVLINIRAVPVFCFNRLVYSIIGIAEEIVRLLGDSRESV